MAKSTLTVRDDRTGKEYVIPITDGAIRATDLGQIKTDDEDAGLMVYAPAFLNTASVKSSITYIDADLGILRYRGYPIEQLAERSTYLEVAYLLIHGELPTEAELAVWAPEITFHTFLHENVKRLMEGFRYDAHPMGMFVSVAAALSTFYPESRHVDDAEVRMEQVVRLIAKTPTIAAWSYRHSRGLPYVFAHHFSGEGTGVALDLYRSSYRPSPEHPEPRTFLTVNAVVAETEEEALRLALPNVQQMIALRTGAPLHPQRLVEQAEAVEMTPEQEAFGRGMARRWVVGSAEQARARLEELATTYDVDEVMVHPVAGAFAGTDPAASPTREQTLRLLAS